MIDKRIYYTALIVLMSFGYLQAQSSAESFKVIPLGVKGGLDESNLSAYMIAPAGSENYICADAGTLRHGIDVAVQNGLFKESAEEVLKSKIKGYLISHAHLDHVAGLIMNAPDDSPKSIYALPSVIDVLRDKYFTWTAWANFTNEGELPRLNKYTYTVLKQGVKKELTGTEMEVVPFSLSHGPGYESTAFLISNKEADLLYLGDTGSDEIEKTTQLEQLWKSVAPLIVKGKLKAIFIETSFANAQPENLLFGHLNPRLLMLELKKLSALTGLAALQKVAIVITHTKAFGQQEKDLALELDKTNNLGLKLVYPVQGKVMSF